jgi:hypothetical protein
VRYFLRTVIGLGLMVASFVALAYSVYQLLQVGTCASGGPYVPARQCPAGIERLGFAIPVAIFVILIGMVIYAGRGPAPGSDRPPRPGMGLVLLWCGIFFGIAFACFWGVWGPDANPGPGGKLGGLIVGFLFVPMGIGGALMFWRIGPISFGGMQSMGIGGVGDVVKMTRAAGSGDLARLAEMTGTGPVVQPTGSGGDVAVELERLNTLRKEGAITEQEFEQLKRRALDRI